MTACSPTSRSPTLGNETLVPVRQLVALLTLTNVNAVVGERVKVELGFEAIRVAVEVGLGVCVFVAIAVFVEVGVRVDVGGR